MTNNNWSVYIIKASDEKLYTGITTDIQARWLKHQQKKGAKFFRGRFPVALCYLEPNHTRSSASKREAQIKKLSHQNKQQLIFEHYGPFHKS